MRFSEVVCACSVCGLRRIPGSDCGLGSIQINQIFIDKSLLFCR
nr:MAG TPA: hypothetical protein [Caudoviricetes sp.]